MVEMMATTHNVLQQLFDVPALNWHFCEHSRGHCEQAVKLGQPSACEGVTVFVKLRIQPKMPGTSHQIWIVAQPCSHRPL